MQRVLHSKGKGSIKAPEKSSGRDHAKTRRTNLRPIVRIGLQMRDMSGLNGGAVSLLRTALRMLLSLQGKIQGITCKSPAQVRILMRPSPAKPRLTRFITLIARPTGSGNFLPPTANLSDIAGQASSSVIRPFAGDFMVRTERNDEFKEFSQPISNFGNLGPNDYLLVPT